MLATGSFIAVAELHRRHLIEEAARDRAHTAPGAETPHQITTWIWALPIALVLTIALLIAVMGNDPATAVSIGAGP
ncbi:MAG: hypothetical protein U0031_03615 [Thermomicrobiales bacterium]